MPFGWKTVALELQKLGAEPDLRCKAGEPFETDQGNYIFDCLFPAGITEPGEIGKLIDSIPGVVTQGMFLGMADRVIIASEGGARVLERS